MIKHTVSCKAHDKARSLQPERHIEIFRDMTFRPELLDTILHEGDTLNGFPSEEGIVADERRTITITD